MTDRQWEDIKDLLPPAKPGGRRRSLEMREVLNAIYYLLSTGCQWRALPREYPCWQSVYSYFRQWSRDGTWQRIHDTQRARLRRKLQRHKHPTAGIIDSQSVKTAAHRGIRGYDAGKRVDGRKRHALVDTLGLLLCVIVTAANVSDTAGAIELIKRSRYLRGGSKKLRLIWSDQSYKVIVREWLLRCHCLLSVVERPKQQKGFAVLPRRWVVERTFAWLTQSRRLVKDYEELPRHSEAMIYIAMTRLMTRRLASN
jgi:putative transposase